MNFYVSVDADRPELTDAVRLRLEGVLDNPSVAVLEAEHWTMRMCDFAHAVVAEISLACEHNSVTTLRRERYENARISDLVLRSFDPVTGLSEPIADRIVDRADGVRAIADAFDELTTWRTTRVKLKQPHINAAHNLLSRAVEHGWHPPGLDKKKVRLTRSNRAASARNFVRNNLDQALAIASLSEAVAHICGARDVSEDEAAQLRQDWQTYREALTSEEAHIRHVTARALAHAIGEIEPPYQVPSLGEHPEHLAILTDLNASDPIRLVVHGLLSETLELGPDMIAEPTPLDGADSIYEDDATIEFSQSRPAAQGWPRLLFCETAEEVDYKLSFLEQNNNTGFVVVSCPVDELDQAEAAARRSGIRTVQIRSDQLEKIDRLRPVYGLMLEMSQNPAEDPND